MDATHSATTRPANDTTYRYLTCAERTAKIRAALKSELGASARDISVRISGGSIRVDIRSCNFRKSDVERIAYQFQSIDRCKTTGEILSGGNTFVFVQYTDEATGTLRALLQSQVDADPSGWTTFCMDAHVVVIGSSNGQWCTMVNGSQGNHCFDASGAVRLAVEAYLDLPRADMAVAS